MSEPFSGGLLLEQQGGRGRQRLVPGHTLLHTDRHGFSCPVNFRRVDKAEGKTKPAHFRDMVAEVLGRGLRPADRWSSGVENLKFLKDQGPGFLIALKKNRVVSEEVHVSLPRCASWTCPGRARVVPLRKVGFVTGFRTVDKHGTARHYAQSDPRKKAPEDRLWPLQTRARSAREDRVLPPCAQGSLPRVPLLRARERSDPQPRFLLATCVPQTRKTTLTRNDQQLVPVQTPPRRCRRDKLHSAKNAHLRCVTPG